MIQFPKTLLCLFDPLVHSRLPRRAGVKHLCLVRPLSFLETGVAREKNPSVDGGGPHPHDREAEPVPGAVPLHQPLQAGAASAECGVRPRGAGRNHGAGAAAGQPIASMPARMLAVGVHTVSGQLGVWQKPRLTAPLAGGSSSLPPALSEESG